MSVHDTISKEWMAVPLRKADAVLAQTDPDMCNAAITVEGEFEGDIFPCLLIDGISLTLARHIVELHNAAVAKPSPFEGRHKRFPAPDGHLTISTPS